MQLFNHIPNTTNPKPNPSFVCRPWVVELQRFTGVLMLQFGIGRQQKPNQPRAKPEKPDPDRTNKPPQTESWGWWYLGCCWRIPTLSTVSLGLSGVCTWVLGVPWGLITVYP
eukprot:6055981-Amphidinium_carterae.1